MSKETRKKAIEFIDEVYKEKDKTIKLQWSYLSYKLFNEALKEQYEKQIKLEWKKE